MSTGKQHLTDIVTDSSCDQSQTIPVIEEKLVITSENVETGRVLVSKRVLEEEATWNGIIAREELRVERKEINQYVKDAPAAVRQEGDVTIVSVVKEVLVVEKRLMLVEELHITRHHHQEQQSFTETLRKEEVTVFRNASGTDV
ncbi:YsnF/AvaK domain-containing protein [Dyadobacter sediminis]|uniref:DUF2382 domain-containing protein n=2 Tax=Dyadobacter TaxID=120831 RepID=A0A5R9K535_9BACT|nr:YsnF/AvaK domain-containing protein [Dyadobacter sediminis]TLU88699.1 DUF2382 domain-containing protein [Dyadobacter sediminis]GGC13984.1 hypothetical protein GCM10011325_46150 [Dyadobacter sediminis]